MTKTEARKTLGITSNTSHTKAKLIYRQKQQKLQAQLLPGTPRETREKAKHELAELTEVWHIIQTTTRSKPRTTKPVKRKKPAKHKIPTQQPTTVKVYTQPETLGDFWDELISSMPFSEPVAVIILILMFLIFMMFILSIFL
jgi:hypothetical protein